MKPKVYIETTVVSYLMAKPSRDAIAVARQVITREWWSTERDHYELVISRLVIDEAGKGDRGAAQYRLDALRDIPLLDFSQKAQHLAMRFVTPGAIPEKAKDDAMHLALCTVHRIPYILTWNFRHIANPEHMRLLRNICQKTGSVFPEVCTPEQMMKGRL
ncbi:MAG: type II toxin-antitoxin system VapC family toxin [Opitutaceae bacterium]|nr:type II toxin-antitoxin system VapC family toxin [Opitutaceae bacterium]